MGNYRQKRRKTSHSGRPQRMRRSFISFDYDDKALKNYLKAQLRHPRSPFTASDWSMKEAAPQAHWEREAAHRIKRSSIVIVLLGRNTYRAPGVHKEVAIARRLGKPIIQMIGRKNSRPIPVRHAGRMIRWTWTNLNKVLKPRR